MQLLTNMRPPRIGRAPLDRLSAEPSIGPQVLYAFGDLHGRVDLLDALLAEIGPELEQGAHLVGLGDFIDRGPHSRETLSRLFDVAEALGPRAVWLRGNHEQLALDFLGSAETWPRWLRLGGRETLMSYGVDVRAGSAPEELRAAFAQALPAAHLELLRTTRLKHQRGDYVFVHAGLAPRVTLDDQDPQDLLWSRPPDGDDDDSAWVVVHGHTPVATARADGRRINLDTGAFATGVLSAVRLCGCERRILAVGAPRHAGAGEVRAAL